MGIDEEGGGGGEAVDHVVVRVDGGESVDEGDDKSPRGD